MRPVLTFVVAASLLTAGCAAGRSVAPSETSPAPPREEKKRAVDFETDVRPILEKCRPCHFEGGKMYAKLPFDRPSTVLVLGEDLFTRIEDEAEREVIREFLEP